MLSVEPSPRIDGVMIMMERLMIPPNKVSIVSCDCEDGRSELRVTVIDETYTTTSTNLQRR